jgi:hypothetical protein
MSHVPHFRVPYFWENVHEDTIGLATFLGVGTQFDTTALSVLLQLGVYKAHNLHFGAKLY